MSDGSLGQVPTVFSSKERAALVAKALSEAARRARFSTKRRRSATSGGLRARRGERIMRLVRMVSFVGIVAVPITVFGIYIFAVASSQYSAEARFTVISGIPAGDETGGASKLAGLAGEMIVQNTQIIMAYLESRAAVETLDKSIGLKSLFENPDIDYFSRLSKRKPIEKVVKYWDSHLDLKVQLPSGIVTFAVRAFSPQDSVRITRAALDAAEELVNRLNDQIRADAVRVADNARKSAQTHLVATRTALEEARNQEGMLSAEATSESFSKLIDETRSQMMALQESYDSQRRFVSADAPQLRNLKTKIDAARSQIAELEARITAGATASATAAATNSAGANAAGGAPAGEGPSDDGAAAQPHVLSMSMTRLDYARLENEIAEKIYAASLAAVEQARIASEIKLMYVNRFIEPVLPEQSRYPRRGLDFAIMCIASLAIWGIILLATRVALNKLL